ncbi:hypothetical protein [Xanthomonas axonopodis]|uniref:hypothetical protein n=1 Tax=Xanthomonas axonopodis TaxID=53413 RepID=UPI001072D881|nr:hypothetical protein [Xanthomonas axonopodis]
MGFSANKKAGHVPVFLLSSAILQSFPLGSSAGGGPQTPPSMLNAWHCDGRSWLTQLPTLCVVITQLGDQRDAIVGFLDDPVLVIEAS